MIRAIHCDLLLVPLNQQFTIQKTAVSLAVQVFGLTDLRSAEFH
jgi:hypothetical protein